MNDRHRPRIFTAPRLWDRDSILSAHLAEITELGGQPLDTWQHLVLEKAARVVPRATGVFARAYWSASEIGVVAGRRNGMSVLAEARELGGMYVLGEKVVHTAPSRPAASIAMRRTAQIIKSSPALFDTVDKMYWAVGEEEITLHNGGSIRFCSRGSARSIDMARGADLLVIDDATDIDDFWWINAVGTRPESWRHGTRQVWYLGAAVDRKRHPHGQVFSRIRRHGLTGTDPHLCWLEYSAPDVRRRDGTLRIVPTSRYRIAQANPSPRIPYEKARSLHSLLDPRVYETDVLGIGDWYDPIGHW